MTIQKDPLNQSYKKADLLNPQSQAYQDNKYWLRPGETPEQYKQRTQPISVDTTEAPMPPAFEPTQLTQDTLSLQGQLETQRKQIEDSYQKQLDDLKAERERQEKIQQEQAKKQEGILGQLETQTTPFRQDLETSERQRLQIEQNYFANQNLVNELDKLLTESTNLTRQLSQQRVPGLAGLQQSERMIKAQETAQSRIAVIEAVMSARNNQIGVGLGFIDRSLNNIQQDRQDRIDYLKSVYDYYEKTRTEAGTKIFNLSQDEKEMINKQIGLLEADYERAEATAQKIKDLMLENPQMVAEAGISLNDTEAEISKKLADWQYTTEIREMKNKMEAEGIREVPIPNANTFSHTDSRGITRHFELPPDTPDWQLRSIGNNLYRIDPQSGQMQLLAGAGTSGITEGIADGITDERGITLSPEASRVLENPSLLENYTPTRRGELLDEIARAGGMAETVAQQSTTRMVQNALGTLETLKDIKTPIGRLLSLIPGREAGESGIRRITGLTSWNPINLLPGTAGANAQALLTTLKDQLTLPNLEFARGLGRMSQEQFRTLANASQTLETRMSDDMFMRELDRIEEALRGYLNETQSRGASSVQGAGYEDYLKIISE